MTDTRSALGAQTAKYVPSTPCERMILAPSLSKRRKCVPSLNKYRSWGVSMLSGSIRSTPGRVCCITSPRVGRLCGSADSALDDVPDAFERNGRPFWTVIQLIRQFIDRFFQFVCRQEPRGISRRFRPERGVPHIGHIGGKKLRPHPARPIAAPGFEPRAAIVRLIGQAAGGGIVKRPQHACDV